MQEKIFRSVIQDFLTEKGYTYTLTGHSHVMTGSRRGFDAGRELLKNGTALRDTSAFSTLEIKGEDTLDFLNRITTNELKNLRPGESRRTIFCTDKGRIIDSVLVVNEGTRFLLFGSAGSSDRLCRWINRYIITDDVHVKDLTGSLGSLEIYGPQAQTMIILISGIKDEEENRIYNFEFEERIFSLVKYRFAGKLERYLLFGEPRGFEKLASFVADYEGPFNIGFVSEEAISCMNVEYAAPGNAELTDLFNPHEVGLLDEVSFKKGCYIGQEVIARLDTYDKVQKLLTRLEISNGHTFELPASLFDSDGKEAGVITTISTSPGVKCSLALGLVRKSQLHAGNKLSVGESGSKITATVKEL